MENGTVTSTISSAAVAAGDAFPDSDADADAEAEAAAVPEALQAQSEIVMMLLSTASIIFLIGPPLYGGEYLPVMLLPILYNKTAFPKTFTRIAHTGIRFALK